MQASATTAADHKRDSMVEKLKTLAKVKLARLKDAVIAVIDEVPETYRPLGSAARYTELTKWSEQLKRNVCAKDLKEEIITVTKKAFQAEWRSCDNTVKALNDSADSMFNAHHSARIMGGLYGCFITLTDAKLSAEDEIADQQSTRGHPACITGLEKCYPVLMKKFNEVKEAYAAFKAFDTARRSSLEKRGSMTSPAVVSVALAGSSKAALSVAIDRRSSVGSVGEPVSPSTPVAVTILQSSSPSPPPPPPEGQDNSAASKEAAVLKKF